MVKKSSTLQKLPYVVGDESRAKSPMRKCIEMVKEQTILSTLELETNMIRKHWLNLNKIEPPW